MKKLIQIFILIVFIGVVLCAFSFSAPLNLNNTLEAVQSVIDQGYPMMTVSVVSVDSTDCCLMPGDVNWDGTVNIADLITWINCLIFGECIIDCPEQWDIDASGSLDIADIVYMVTYMFGGGPAPLPCP